MSNVQSTPSRIWLILGGAISILGGLFAITYPLVASVAVTQMIGILALLTGLFEFFPAVFSNKVSHRVFTALMALVRILAGGYLFFLPLEGKQLLTLFLAILLLVEGVFSIIAAVRLRPAAGWIWLLINGLVGFVLGAMIYVRWPNDSDYVIGLLFGINCIFVGTTLLMLSPEALAKLRQSKAESDG